MQQKVFGRQDPVYDEKYAKAGGLHMTYAEAKAAMKQENCWNGRESDSWYAFANEKWKPPWTVNFSLKCQKNLIYFAI